VCERDYYYDNRTCHGCPWSATCPQGSTLGSPWGVRAGFYRFSMDTPAIYRCRRLCGNRISGAPRRRLDGVEFPGHRRDVVPVAASARWRGGSQRSNLTHWLISTQASATRAAPAATRAATRSAPSTTAGRSASSATTATTSSPSCAGASGAAPGRRSSCGSSTPSP
jgi:hypothetical protein